MSEIRNSSVVDQLTHNAIIWNLSHDEAVDLAEVLTNAGHRVVACHHPGIGEDTNPALIQQLSEKF